MKKSEIYKYTCNIRNKLGLSSYWKYTDEEEVRILLDTCFKYHFKQFQWKHENIDEFFIITKQLLDSYDKDNFLIALELLYNLERK